LAPETIIGNGVNKSVDVYGIGLLLYEMVSGYPPHFTYNIEDLINRIQYSPVNYDAINSLSNSVKKLLKSILKKDNSKRPTIA
jgi:serum/glucocorticoid-regulated kinase 2